MPFSLEGFAFFTEAIFLGVYLYGWDRISPRAHLAAGLIVAVSGAASAVFVVMVNAWMNTPAGRHDRSTGRSSRIDPIAGMFNPSTFQQALHMLLAAYAATGLAVAGIHAAVLLKRRDDARSIATRSRSRCCIGAPAALLQPLSGDVSARTVAQWQPIKLAALEGQFDDGARRAAAHRRLARRGRAAHALRDRDSARAVAARLPRSERRGDGTRRRFRASSGRRSCPCTSAFRSWSALGTAMALVSAWVGVRRHQKTLIVRRSPAAAARAGDRRAVRLHRHGSRMDGDRSRTPAVGGAGNSAHGRRRDADAGPHRPDARCSRFSISCSARSSSCSSRAMVRETT